MDDEVEILRELSVNRVFMTKDAEQAGVPRLRLVELARERALTHLTRGGWSTETPEDPVERHLLRTIAITRRHAHRSGATAHSAILLRGLPLVDADLSRVHLVRGDVRTTRRGSDFTVWSPVGNLVPVEKPPRIEVPVPCAPVAVSLVHAGLVGTPNTALVAADAAVARQLVTPAEIAVATAEVSRGVKGIGAVRRALSTVDGRHESPGETLTRQVCTDLGYELEPQVWVGPWRVDFLITGTRVILEFDGAAKYDDRGDLVAEKRREDDLRRRGYVVVRLMWSDLRHPRRVRGLIEAALRVAVA
ncbi:endonuclease domain-containing protein [Janibacter alittae]|uniref:DUF559 domain-containing protein n=1 Tax=Janibacter alittae TaxID=3115209 RepID=A0ABZ2MFH5_9MICO